MNFLVKDGKEMVRFLGVIIGSIIIAIAFNLFLIPHKILSSGIGGIAIILGIVTPVNTGIINFVLNLPILILGYIGLGKKVIFNTIVSVIVLSVALYYVPVKVVATDPLLSSIFGGVIAGAVSVLFLTVMDQLVVSILSVCFYPASETLNLADSLLF